ncbi:ABC transporter ATP-binding protein [Bacillus alveayuensis]|jgi:ABC-type multidrug transport system ATPase subunit|uniref:ABC transporter ATP-binding protein n=1 Tax=Aeribacillus alveayuensis TaxID=279215 RepID=UPI0005CD6E18|nr:ABC transporter ATP-binding protein [Bacillus alveayuensis]
MLEIKNVSKSLGKEKVLENINLTLQKGEVFGLLGRNGSGKTTLLRIIQQILLPDEGDVLFNNEPIRSHPKCKEKILYVPVRNTFFEPFTSKQLVSMMKGIYPTFDVTYANELMNRYRLPENKSYQELSTGLKKQVSLILAFASRPDVILMDEPTDGIDAVTRYDILQLMMEEVAQRETSIFITSHRLEDIERICNRIGFLDNHCLSQVMDVDEMNKEFVKIQVAYEDDVSLRIREKEITILEHAGVFYTILLKKADEEKKAFLKSLSPRVWNELPVNLEEIFLAKFGGKRRW